jgi:hypothetical protein
MAALALTMLALAVPLEAPDEFTPAPLELRSICDRTCRRRARMRRVVRPYAGWLARVRACESGGDYRAATGNGYYGAYQFLPATWFSVGGRVMPHQATRLAQDYRAVLLLRRSGAGQWPVCG